MLKKRQLRNIVLTAGLLATSVLLGISSATAKGRAQTQPVSSRSLDRMPPNVVVILLDDAGFGQPSTFGGPASTPTLDKLAAQGLRYNRFHVSAQCSPTRASLLTGRNAHTVGFGTVVEARTNDPGYNMTLPKSAASIADVLRTNGYSTAAFGKWHNTPNEEISPTGPFDRWPSGLGFDYFYGFMSGWEDHWEPSRLYRGTTPVEPSNSRDEGYYLTSDLVDDAVKWVQTQRAVAPDQPYFMYFAPGAVHWPHQAPKDYIDKYRGRFDKGWDALREETFARQKTQGIIPDDAELTPRPSEIPAWDELTSDQKRVSARQMEVFAAFLEYTDHEIGRMIKAVQEAPGGDNTLILYIAGDNGAQPGTNENQLPAAYIQHQLAHLDEIGGSIPGVIGSGWAFAANTPFQWGKFFGSHLGGTRNPLVVSWPVGIEDRGSVRSQYTHVTDLAPTLYELAGIKPPAIFNGVKQLPIEGTSFAYSFDAPDSPSRHRLQVFETVGNRSIYQDGWLASARHMLFDTRTGAITVTGDFEGDRWELYNLTEDFSQARDLAGQHPEKLKELRQLFDQEARRTNIYPLRNFPLPPILPTRPDGRSEYIFHAGLPRLSALAAPHFYEASYTISVDITVPREAAAQGVLVSYGSRMGGFALYARDGKLVYEANDGNRHTAITSHASLSAGNAVVSSTFLKDETAQADPSGVTVGTVRLYVDGLLVAEQAGVRQAFSFVSVDSGTFGIGRAYGSPVSEVIGVPGTFNGELRTVRVQLR